MVLTKDDLQAISHIFDEKFDSIDKRFEAIDEKFEAIDEKFETIDNRLKIMELKQDRMSKQLDDLRFEVKASERNIRKDIYRLQDEMETVIEVLRQNEMIPH